MAESNISGSSEIKALFRDLEYRKDLRFQMKIEQELLFADLIAFREKVKVELKHNNNLTKQLQQLKSINEREKEKHEYISAIRCTLAKGSLDKILSFLEGQIENYKRFNDMKQADFEQMIQDHIDNLIRQRPQVVQYHQKEVQIVEVERKLSILREQKAKLMERDKKEQQINHLFFEQNIVDMAKHAVRHYHFVEQAKNPDKKILKPASLKPIAKVTMYKRVLHKSLEPRQGLNEKLINVQHVSSASSSLKHQQLMLDTSRGNSQDFDRNSRGGTQFQRTEEAKQQGLNDVPNKESLQTFKPQFFSDKQNVKDKNEKEKAKYAKHPTLSVSSSNFSTDGSITSQTIQKGKKAKVTFADTEPTQSLTFRAKEYEGVSSSNSNLAAMDMEMSLENGNENEIQMSDNDENDVQMNISDPAIDVDIDKISNFA